MSPALDTLIQYARLILDDALMEENDAELRQSVVDEISEYANDLTLMEGYQIDAYQVICDDTNNPSSVINAGEIRVTIAVVSNGKRQIAKLRAP